jgi:hypothetical protein
MDDEMMVAPSVVATAAARNTEGVGERRRRLGGGKDNEEDGYFVDGNGNAYESYAMAWRYLGLFIDCSSSDSEQNRGRDLKENINNDNGSSSSSTTNCQRRLLWAAYVDEQCKGGSIGEYSMFDRRRDGMGNYNVSWTNLLALYPV